MIRKAIKYDGNKEFVKQIVKTLPRKAPDRLVTFHKGEIKVIGDDIGELAARDLLVYYPSVYKETEVEVDDLTFAEETLKIIKEDLVHHGLKEEEVDRVMKSVMKPEVQEVQVVEVQIQDPKTLEWLRVRNGVVVARQEFAFENITIWNVFPKEDLQKKKGKAITKIKKKK